MRRLEPLTPTPLPNRARGLWNSRYQYNVSPCARVATIPSMDNADYDPRYLAGIVLFNRGDYFEAHEVWEELWADSHGTERKFHQGL